MKRMFSQEREYQSQDKPNKELATYHSQQTDQSSSKSKTLADKRINKEELKANQEEEEQTQRVIVTDGSTKRKPIVLSYERRKATGSG